MANADGTTVGVDLVDVKVKGFDVGEDDDTESFVDFPHSNVLLFHSCHFQHLQNEK
jgi:hypothetical protein